MPGPLPIKKYSDSGSLVVRDGLVFVLFIDESHAEIADRVTVFLNHVIETLGDARFTLIHDRGELLRPFDAKKLSSLRGRLTGPALRSGKSVMFTIRDGLETEVATTQLQYYGCRNDRSPTEVSYVEMWFPTERAAPEAAQRFVGELLALASTLPFASGYCSIGLNYEDWARFSAKQFARAIARRYPGIDVHNSSITSLYIDGAVRGAYWLTFLGPRVLERLGKTAASLRAELGPDITVHEIRNGIALQAGALPEPGDVNRNERLPLVRKIAALIGPVQFVQKLGIIFGDVDEFIAWQLRHVL